MTTRLLPPLLALTLFACNPGDATRKSAARPHKEAAEKALAERRFERAQLAAELAAQYDPLDPALRDLLLRVRLTALADAPPSLVPSRIPELEYDAEAMEAKDSANAHVYATARGWLAFARGDVAKAEELFRQVIKEQPAFAPARVGLGTVLVQKKERDQAIAILQEAITHEPKHRAALAQLGLLFADKGDFDQALTLLKRAQAEGDGADVRLGLAAAYTGKRMIGEAGEELKAAVRLDPNSAEAHRRLGDLLAAVGQYPLAEQAFLTAQKLSNDPMATLGLGTVYLRRGQYAEASRLLENVLAQMPDNAFALYEAAIAAQSLGNRERAKALFEAYLARAEKDPAEASRLGDAKDRLAQVTAPPAPPTPAVPPKK